MKQDYRKKTHIILALTQWTESKFLLDISFKKSETPAVFMKYFINLHHVQSFDKSADWKSSIKSKNYMHVFNQAIVMEINVFVPIFPSHLNLPLPNKNDKQSATNINGSF